MFNLVLLQLILYFGYGIIIGIVEKMNFNKYKFQIGETFIKMLILNVIPRYIFYKNINGNLIFPSTYSLVVKTIFYLLTQDIFFWAIHSIIHKEPFYTKIHKQHHSKNVIHQYGIFGKYMSCMDYIMFEMLNMPLKIIFYQKSIISMCLIDSIDYLLTVSSHSKIFNLDKHHKLHHLHQQYNFGITPISDLYFNTLYKKLK